MRDIILDLRDSRRWAEDSIPRGIALLVEKWLGFWFAFLLAIVTGWAGLTLFETARWAGNIEVLNDTVPWLIPRIGSFGLIVILLSGLGMLAVLVVSAARVLLWIRDRAENYWEKHTPRHADTDAEPEALPWPPEEEELDRARERFWEFTYIGSLLFLIISSTLLWLESNYPNQLHAVVSHPGISSVGDVANAAIWMLSIDGLFGTVSPSVSQAWVVYSILIFVLPGIFIAIAARNLLFLTEGLLRSDIEKVIEGSIPSRTGFKLIGYLALFSLWTVGILYQVIQTL